MWNACFESVQQIEKSRGTGCILAHCMGLGKTLQVVTLAHTLLSNNATKVKKILVLVPMSTVLNWNSEFNLWLKDMKIKFMIGDLSKIKLYESTLNDWHSRGGVMAVSYGIFRDLISQPLTGIPRNSEVQKQINEALLDPGPDLLVCDEGHLLKSESTKTFKTMTEIRTRRRIVLTGTPLQNNLAEYHCMVQFVEPNLLETSKNFQHLFVNPIINGSYLDSTALSVKLMKRRAYVLNKILEGSMQRLDYAVLSSFIPPKKEYAIFVRLADLQAKLYQQYLYQNAPKCKSQSSKLFTDIRNLQYISTHPRILQMNSKKKKNIKRKLIMENDSKASQSNKKTTLDSGGVCAEEGNGPPKKKAKRRTHQNADAESEDEPEVKEEVEEYQEWWQPLIEDDSVFSNLAEGGKLMLLFYILRECEKIGDKVLVFSQFLPSLDLIEYFLCQINEAKQNDRVDDSLCNHTGSWSRGLDYFRFDGGTSLDNRSSFCKEFNNEDNLRARLFLISTKTGGVGINLQAANRVIIFDASWNPSDDIQSVYRLYRLGQKKPCYAYRFIAKGTIDEKIYKRQITKLSLSCRVVDEQQVDRHYSMADLQELYTFNPESPTTKSTLKLPEDRLLAKMLKEHKNVIEEYHEHNALLENNVYEKLNEEEREAAWKDYEEEKKGMTEFMGGFQTGGLPQLDSVALKEAPRKEMCIDQQQQQSSSSSLPKVYASTSRRS